MEHIKYELFLLINEELLKRKYISEEVFAKVNDILYTKIKKVKGE